MLYIPLSDEIRYMFETLKVENLEDNRYRYKDLNFRITNKWLSSSGYLHSYTFEPLLKETFQFGDGVICTPRDLRELKETLDMLNDKFGFKVEENDSEESSSWIESEPVKKAKRIADDYTAIELLNALTIKCLRFNAFRQYIEKTRMTFPHETIRFSMVDNFELVKTIERLMKEGNSALQVIDQIPERGLYHCWIEGMYETTFTVIEGYDEVSVRDEFSKMLILYNLKQPSGNYIVYVKRLRDILEEFISFEFDVKVVETYLEP